MSTTESQHREALHRLAVSRVLEGYNPEEVANFLEVDRASVYRWLAAYRQHGEAGLAVAGRAGRPPKLTARQTRQVLAWIDQDPQQLGFTTSRWTAPRLAALIARRWEIAFHPHSLNRWLTAHRISPQIPQPVARERDPVRIDHWIREEFPRIKKTPTIAEQGYFQPTNAAS